MKKNFETFNDKVQKQFEIICRKCGSKNVVINYEEDGGYSEYTNWGSSFSMGCNDCKQNDFYE